MRQGAKPEVYKLIEIGTHLYGSEIYLKKNKDVAKILKTEIKFVRNVKSSTILLKILN
jgi:hypothetical protein